MSDEKVYLDWVVSPEGERFHSYSGDVITLAPTGRGPMGWYDVITVSVEGLPQFIEFPAHLCREWGCEAPDGE